MDGGPEKRGGNPLLLDLIPRNRDWLVSMDEQNIHGCLEEKKLELRLGLPGQGLSNRKESTETTKERDESILSLGYVSMSSRPAAQKPFSSSVKLVEAVSWTSPFHSFPSTAHGLPAMSQEVDMQSAEKQPFLPSSSGSASPKNSQKRSAPAPVVGWPPVRSFRKNLTNTTSSNSKPFSDINGGVPSKVLPGENPTKACKKGHFVKINMDGVPIGRKVDLSVNDSYEKLSFAVIELFRSLLTGQRDREDAASADPERNWGLMDRSGEYTLIYEDNEGDRMLAGDVPWHMFVSTVKRLRVMKSSEISSLTLVNSMGGQNPSN